MSRRGPRSAPSTCARSRTRSSGCCPGRRSSRRSCAPTRRRSGSTRSCWSRSTAPPTSRARRPSTCSRSARPRWRATGAAAAASARRRARPWVVIGLAAVAVVGVLLVIGLLERRRQRAAAAASEQGQHDDHDRAKPQQKTEAEDRGRRRRRSRCGSSPPTRSTSASTPAPGTDDHASRASSTRPRTFRGGQRLRVNLGKTDVQLTEQRQDGADRAGSRAGRLRVHADAPPSRCRSASAPAPDAGPRGDRRDRHRGADRPGARPQRAVAVRPPARAGRGAGAHHDLRRPPRGHDGPAAVHGRPGRRPGDHERRARPDRRRPHDRDRGALHRTRADPRRRPRGAHRGDPAPADEALPPPGLRRRARGQPQAGAGARGRARDLPGRHRARAWSCRASRRSWCCPGRRASCTRCGREAVETEAFQQAIGGRTQLRAADAAAVRHPGVGDRGDAARGRGVRRGLRRARDHDLPAPRRGGGGHALGAARPGGLGRGAGPDRRAPRAHALLDRRLDRRRPGGRAAGGPLGGGGRVVHGRADGGAADRAARVVGVLRGRGGELLERGQARTCWAWTPR